MLGCTATSGSAMSTDRQTQPWTRSARSTTSASADQVSAPGDFIRALLTSIQSAQLSSDLDTIVAAPDGSCVPAPLSSVCTEARCERANRPNRPLGRLAGESCWPGAGDARKPHQVAERQAELVGAEPLRVIGELVEDGLVQAGHRGEELRLRERRGRGGRGRGRLRVHDVVRLRRVGRLGRGEVLRRDRRPLLVRLRGDQPQRPGTGAGTSAGTRPARRRGRRASGPAARSVTSGSCVSGSNGGWRTAALTRRRGSNSSAITQPRAKTAPAGCSARSSAAGTRPRSLSSAAVTQPPSSSVAAASPPPLPRASWPEPGRLRR